HSREPKTNQASDGVPGPFPGAPIRKSPRPSPSMSPAPDTQSPANPSVCTPSNSTPNNSGSAPLSCDGRFLPPYITYTRPERSRLRLAPGAPTRSSPNPSPFRSPAKLIAPLPAPKTSPNGKLGR